MYESICIYAHVHIYVHVCMCMYMPVLAGVHT